MFEEAKKMFNLIKKDYLIIKRVWIGLMAIALIIPILLAIFGEGVEIPAGITLTMMEMILAVTLFSALYEEEEKYPKAAAMMTTIGYPRATIIKARYALMIAVFLYCSLVYTLESFAIEALAPLHFTDFAAALFLNTLVMSFYLALVIRYGVRASRYISVFVILAISLGPAAISTMGLHLDLDFLTRSGGEMIALFLLLSTGILFSISMKISIETYRKKEL